jgi:replication initiation and membrane attachment protein DnaB
MSYNYLIEIINDDEDEVRFKTLEILIELIEIFKVSDSETLAIVLFNLKENSQLLRKYLYKLISKVYVNKTPEFDLVLEVF